MTTIDILQTVAIVVLNVVVFILLITPKRNR